MYLAGVSVRRIEDITEALWGMRVSPATVSDLNKKIYGAIEGGGTARSRPSIRTCFWTASCSSAVGPGKCATSPCWGRSASIVKVFERFLASARAPRKTRRAGVRSSSTSRDAV
jgi:hypothetical protein